MRSRRDHEPVGAALAAMSAAPLPICRSRLQAMRGGLLHRVLAPAPAGQLTLQLAKTVDALAACLAE